MQLTVQGKQIDVGDALRTHVQEKLGDINAKYFNRAIDANVHFAREGQGFYKSHIAIRVGKNIQIMGDAVENDIYLSFDVAAAKVAKQLRRYKNRLRTHHRKIEETPETEILKAQNYVLAMEADSHEEKDDEDAGAADHSALIVAEMTTDIETLSVSEAVMRLDLAHQNALLFRNAKHGGINLVYRRDDGHIGWIDPSLTLPGLQQAAE
jgi:ribosomal subunit interface protein